MAKKKRTLKAEVVDEAGQVNLTGTTRLEFSLNKADIIDFYCSEEEDKLEVEIDAVAKELAATDAEIEELKDTLLSDGKDGEDDEDGRHQRGCPKVIQDAVLKEHKTVINSVKKAINSLNKAKKKLAAIGNENEEEDDEEEEDEPIEVSVRLVHETQKNRYNYYAEVEPWKIKTKGRKVLKGHRRQLGRNVPENKLHDLELGYNFWIAYSYTYQVKEKLCCVLDVGNHRSKVIEFAVEGALKDQLDTLVGKMNGRGKLVKKLHDLLILHAELPSMKKQIKKQVVGRVLKNTDEGKLLLTALRGIRKGGTKLLTDAAADIK